MSSIAARVSPLIRSLAQHALAVDLRSLALFRALLSALLLFDLLRHLPLLDAFYSDAGVLPRGWLPAADTLWRISLHAANGQIIFEWLLLVIAVFAGLALFVGWRTRLACVVSAVLYASLLNRAPVIVTAGERLLMLLLFWSCFLPLQACWSVDAADHRELQPTQSAASPALLSRASTAMLLQVGIAGLWVTALAPGANPLAAMLAQPAYTTAAGLWLHAHPGLTAWAGRLTNLVGLIAPVLLFVPSARGRLRAVAILALALLQIGALICFDLGLAPWVMLAALTLFLGPTAWHRLRARGVDAAPRRLFHDAQRPGSLRLHRLLREFLILPSASLHTAQSQPRTATLLRANDSWIVIDRDDRAYLRWDAMVLLLRRSPVFGPLGWLLAALPLSGAGNAGYGLLRRLRSSRKLANPRPPPRPEGPRQRGVIGTCLLLVLLWNLSLAGLLPRAVQGLLAPPLRLLRLDQPWDRYLPRGVDDHGWFVVPGTLADGHQVDLLRPSHPLSFAVPKVLARRQGGSAWHRYLDGLWRQQDDRDRTRYAQYLCRRWNHHASAERRLQSLKIVYLLERDALATADSVEQHVLWRQDCATAAKPPPAGDD